MSNKFPSENLTAAVHSLGCKVNSYESDAMTAMLREAGYRIVPFNRKADAYVINTCTVTNTADQKSRQMLHRARKMNPDAVIAAVGCYVQTHVEKMQSDPNIDILIGTNEKSRLIPMLQEAFLNRRKAGQFPRAAAPDISGPSAYEELKAHLPDSHTRAVLKIQDGCNQFCSYCAIPLARGRVRSRRQEDILREARLLAGSGVHEIVLTGIHLCSYAAERDPAVTDASPLTDLCAQIAGIPGIERIRLGSLEPGSMSDEVIRAMADNSKICPHFHLSLQSGCDTTLRRMNRRYSTEQFRAVCDRLRQVYDEPTLTTDLIVGFPGETEEEFEQTRLFVSQIRFYHTHIFKYSRRDGTRAASMPGQISGEVKSRRSKVLSALNDAQKEYYRKKFEGRTAEVLLEEPAGGGWVGYTREYVKVLAKGDGFARNDLITGIIGKEFRVID